MTNSLRYVDTTCQRIVDSREKKVLPFRVAHSIEERQALGSRLKAARELARMTQQDACSAFAAKGYKIGKAAISAWEKGRNVPDALWLRRLAKLYNTTLDALVWEDSLSPTAMKIAAEYDNLNGEKRRQWDLLWLGYITAAADGGEKLPAAPKHGIQQQ
jgi:transcriptional regulator with XRE-family HTH domain